MRVKSFLTSATALLLATGMAASASTHHKKSSGHAKSTSASSHHAAPAMDSERATAIQSALIKKGYLSGEPSGQWDASSVAAMQKLQSDNGWQTKYTPDARALDMLGLKNGASSVQSADAGTTTTASNTISN